MTRSGRWEIPTRHMGKNSSPLWLVKHRNGSSRETGDSLSLEIINTQNHTQNNLGWKEPLHTSPYLA